MIYFDNAASTRVDEDVLERFKKECDKNYANTGSFHSFGQNLANNLKKIEKSILETLSLPTSDYEIIFTSGATEANNLAIFGTTYFYRNRGKHIITSKIEHPSVLNCFKKLEGEGYKVTYLDVNKDGLIDINEFKNAISNETILVSIMAVNNEVGTILNLEEIKEVIKNYPKCIFHSDLAQTLGKYDVDCNLFDLMTISSYKIYGLKGIGALIKKKKCNLVPLLCGGTQQNGYRVGTMDYAGIATFDYTIQKAINDYSKNHKHVQELFDYTVSELEKIDEIKVHKFPNQVPYIVNFALKTKSASVFIEALSNEEIYVSTKASCSNKLHSVSHVVEAIYNNEQEALNSIRVSFSKNSTLEECKIFVEKVKEILPKLRS